MKKVSIWQILFILLFYITCAALFQWVSGDLLWVEGLIFNSSILIMCLIVVLGLYFKSPALLAERFRKTGTGGEKKWDIAIVNILKFLWLAWFFMIPIDKRYGYSPVFLPFVKIIGGVFLIISIILITNTFFTNAFLSPLVRTQETQKVITSGAYKIVRHPMYLGLFLLFLSSSLMCGSICGILITILSMIVLVIRINGEEKMLINELVGYAEYKKKTKYRLIPLMW
jgi:protein-S-isoprenylcysteine O-methyltransferase Ste14